MQVEAEIFLATVSSSAEFNSQGARHEGIQGGTWYPIDRIWRMVAEGSIRDGFTLGGLHKEDAARYEGFAIELRQQLGNELYATAWSEGAAMTVEQAAALHSDVEDAVSTAVPEARAVLWHPRPMEHAA